MADINLNDVRFENFVKKVTFISDPSPGAKIKIPDGEFFLCLILLKLENTLRTKS